MTRRETSSLLQWSDSNQSTCYIKIVQTNNKYKSMQVLQQCDRHKKQERQRMEDLQYCEIYKK